VAPAPQYGVGAADARRPAAKDDSTPSSPPSSPPSSKASTDPVLEDPFKIPPSSRAPALGLAGSEPSPRCRIGATADQRACLDAYVAIGDAPLTQAFEALVAELRRRAGASPGAVDPPTVQRVRVEQRAWLSVRNGECPRSPATGAGPFWAQERSECFTEMAAARTAELRDAVRRLRRK
jgi:uncharacterized protein YecT (DUF1311 family)